MLLPLVQHCKALFRKKCAKSSKALFRKKCAKSSKALFNGVAVPRLLAAYKKVRKKKN
jgi:hypothetical protein